MATALRLTSKSDIMAKYYKLLAVGCWLLAASCQEGGDAGDLWGQWRMTDSNAKYLSFSGSITWLKDMDMIGNKENAGVYGNFQCIGDSLFIHFYSRMKEKADTIMVEQSFGLKPFTNIRVKIDVLDNERLLLSKDGQHWSFEKY